MVTAAGVEAMVPISDAALARSAALGDRDAFEAIVWRHGPAMYRYVRRMLDDEGDAQDVVQEALVAAWMGLDRFDSRSALRTWLFSLAAHKAIDNRRRYRAQPVDSEALISRPAGPDTDPERWVAGSELRDALLRALRELPRRQRACWLLVEVEGLTQAEAAQVLSTTPEVVRGQLRRARRNLAERMVQWR